MFDRRLRQWLQPGLGWIAGGLAQVGATPNQLTLAGAVLGSAAGIAVGCGAFLPALALMGLSRLADGLDGPLARLKGSTDFGGYADILADYLFYAAVPLGFAVLSPANALATAVLLASYLFTAVSFLAYSSLAQKRGRSEEADGRGFIFQTGLAEGAETIAAYILMLLVPGWYAWIAGVFAAVCLYTAFSRTVLAWRRFRD